LAVILPIWHLAARTFRPPAAYNLLSRLA